MKGIINRNLDMLLTLYRLILAEITPAANKNKYVGPKFAFNNSENLRTKNFSLLFLHYNNYVKKCNCKDECNFQMRISNII